MPSLNLVALLSSVVLVALIAMGPFSKEDRQAITWGQDLDARAMAVAISRLEYGLGGGIYHRPVEAKLLEHMAGGPSVATEEAHRRSKDPAYVNEALRAAVSLPAETFKTGSVQDGTYGYFGEDLGTADLYALAFRLFGYEFSATHAFYVVLLATSAGLFALSFGTRSAPLAALVLALGALYGLTASALFNDLMPSISAHRGLSTLALIPFTHIICAIRAPERLRPWQLVLVAIQAALLVFVTTFRSSASWTLIAIGLVALASFKYGPSLFTVKRRLGLQHIHQPLAVLLLVAGVWAGERTVEQLTLDPVYFSDWSAGARHTIWHSAYIALPLHPDWPNVKPYPDQPNNISDAVTQVLFANVAMEDCGCRRVWEPNKYYAYGDVRVGVFEGVARDAYLDFAWDHPAYMLELLLIHKPVTYFESAIRQSLTRIHGLVWLTLFGVAVLAALLARSGAAGGRQAATVVILGLVGAHLSVFWAYGMSFVAGDAVWSLLLVGLYCTSRALSLGFDRARRAGAVDMPDAPNRF